MGISVQRFSGYPDLAASTSAGIKRKQENSTTSEVETGIKRKQENSTTSETELELMKKQSTNTKLKTKADLIRKQSINTISLSETDSKRKQGISAISLSEIDQMSIQCFETNEEDATDSKRKQSISTISLSEIDQMSIPSFDTDEEDAIDVLGISSFDTDQKVTTNELTGTPSLNTGQKVATGGLLMAFEKAKEFLDIHCNVANVECLEMYFKFVFCHIICDGLAEEMTYPLVEKVSKCSFPFFLAAKELDGRTREFVYQNLKSIIISKRYGVHAFCKLQNEVIDSMQENAPHLKIFPCFSKLYEENLHYIDYNAIFQGLLKEEYYYTHPNGKQVSVLDLMDFDNIKEQYKYLILSFLTGFCTLFEQSLYKEYVCQIVCNAKKSYYSLMEENTVLKNKMFNIATAYIKKKYGAQEITKLNSEVTNAKKKFESEIREIRRSYFSGLSNEDFFYKDSDGRPISVLYYLSFELIEEQFKCLYLFSLLQQRTQDARYVYTDCMCQKICNSKRCYYSPIKKKTKLWTKMFNAAEVCVINQYGIQRLKDLKNEVESAMAKFDKEIDENFSELHKRHLYFQVPNGEIISFLDVLDLDNIEKQFRCACLIDRVMWLQKERHAPYEKIVHEELRHFKACYHSYLNNNYCFRQKLIKAAKTNVIKQYGIQRVYELEKSVYDTIMTFAA